jgi:hypothetical protein
MDPSTLSSLSSLSHSCRQFAAPFLFTTLRIDHTTSTDALRDLSRRRHILQHVQNVHLYTSYQVAPGSDAEMERMILAFRLCLAHMRQLRVLDIGNVIVSRYFFQEIFGIHTLRRIMAGPHTKTVLPLQLNHRYEFHAFKHLSVFYIESAPLLRILEPAITASTMNLTHLLVPPGFFELPSILKRFTAHPPPGLISITVVDLSCHADHVVLHDLLSSVPNITELEIRSATHIASGPSFANVLPKLRVLMCPAWVARQLAPGRPLHTFKETPVPCNEYEVVTLTILRNSLSASSLAGTQPSGVTTLALSSSCQWEKYVSLIKGILPQVRYLSIRMCCERTQSRVSRHLVYQSHAKPNFSAGHIRFVERTEFLCSNSVTP